MAKTKVTNEDFVVCWTTSRTIEDVLSGTLMSRTAATARARFLRSKGVKLKKLEQNTVYRLDDLAVAQLNSLIKKYSN